MSYKAILVHQGLDGASGSRLAIAADLAQRFDAKLIGAGACAVQPSAYGGGAYASAIIAGLRPKVEKDLKEAESYFRAGTEGKVSQIEWRQDLQKPTAFIAQHARAADLVVIGTARDSVYIDPLTELDPGELIMQAGRPVLVVPPEVTTLQAEHVVVAWKDTREARRAVLDALPLLQAATDVTVVEIIAHSNAQVAPPSGVDVAEWLCRHNVCATAHDVASDFDSYGAFEGLLLQNAADLIVAGAYGHSRLQEWIFGGVTRDLLQKSRYCCLLSN